MILYIVYEIDLVVIIYIYIRLSPVPVPYIHQTEVVTDREGEFLTELNAKSEKPNPKSKRLNSSKVSCFSDSETKSKLSS